MKHTPGPWGCVDTSHHAHDYRLTKPDGTPLPLTVEANDHSEQRANARLIAAAPELLAALKFALRDVETRIYMLPVHDIETRPILNTQAERYRAAIAKAEGRS